jgi:lipoate---protein ligase
MNVFLSPFNNPFINLALEDYFLRGGANLPVAFFYINRPCVVLGRFQNPWLECHLPFLVENDIWMVRRQSGGGCVFHDEGNLNYSFIYPEGMINRSKGVELLQRAFKRADIELEISPRHDLWLDGKKISGSAFKQIKHSSFHHGTFLVSSDLNKLSESLKHTIVSTESKSIPSVRSKVTRLQDKYPEIEIQDVIDLVAHELHTVPITLDGTLLSKPEVQKSFMDLTQWQWLWGETPQFKMEGKSESLLIHKGFLKMEKEIPFTKEAMANFFLTSDLERLFPDFSSQVLGSQVVF